MPSTSPKRDLSPARKPAKFTPSISLEDQVVAWLGEHYRCPVVDVDNQVHWAVWQSDVESFMRKHKVERSEKDQWPFHAVFLFFVLWRSRSAKYLAILSERFFGDLGCRFKEFHAKFWPLVKAEGLENLHYWSELTQAINSRNRFVYWSPAQPGLLKLRTFHPHMASCQFNFDRLFVQEGLDPHFRHLASSGNSASEHIEGKPAYPTFAERGRCVMEQMESLIAENLGYMLAVKGFFQFPSLGSDEFYKKCKEELNTGLFAQEHIWDDAAQTVRVNMDAWGEKEAK